MAMREGRDHVVLLYGGRAVFCPKMPTLQATLEAALECLNIYDHRQLHFAHPHPALDILVEVSSLAFNYIRDGAVLYVCHGNMGPDWPHHLALHLPSFQGFRPLIHIPPPPIYDYAPPNAYAPPPPYAYNAPPYVPAPAGAARPAAAPAQQRAPAPQAGPAPPPPPAYAPAQRAAPVPAREAHAAPARAPRTADQHVSRSSAINEAEAARAARDPRAGRRPRQHDSGAEAGDNIEADSNKPEAKPAGYPSATSATAEDSAGLSSVASCPSSSRSTGVKRESTDSEIDDDAAHELLALRSSGNSPAKKRRVTH